MFNADRNDKSTMTEDADGNMILESDGLHIAARIFRPHAEGKHPAIIVCHGFGSRKENHAEFSRMAAEHGFVALTLDFRGHGASEGCLDSRTINDIGCALSWLSADDHVDPERIAVRGSSMGGYFAIHAAGRSEQVAAVVAICPATESGLSQVLRDSRDPMSEMGRWRRSGEGFPRVMGCDLSCWLDSADIMDAVENISPRPLLLIHAEGDQSVPIASSMELFDHAGQPKTFWRIPGGDHRSAQNDPDIMRRSLEWLAANL